MKKEVIDYRVDTFVDYAGIERKFVVAAVSNSVKNNKLFKRVISIGVSICHPDDEFDEQVGVQLAVAKTGSSNIRLFTTCNGIVSTNVVKTLLEQEALYFKTNPASHIPGYKQLVADYNNKVALADLEAGLNPEQKDLIAKLRTLSKDELANINKLIHV